MDARQFLGGKFLKKEDAERPQLLTIRHASVENVAQDGQPEEKKLVLHFNETDKGLVLNSTNAQTCFEIFGTWETDAWLRGTVVLYSDPNVSFGGKRVGGLRLRPRKGAAPTVPAAAVPAPEEDSFEPAGAEEFEDDIPF